MKNLVGQKFFKLTVIRFHSFYKYPNRSPVPKWECLCECGRIVVVFGNNLTRTKTNSTSCGCDRIIKTKLSNTTHGLSGHPAYGSYVNMMKRCYNPNWENYSEYGGRGIIVCDRWKNHPENFLNDMLPTWKDGLTIDRVDVNGNYELSNCEWRTQKEQCRNKRNNHILEFQGLKLTVAEWAERIGVLDKTLYKRLYDGWSIERTLTTPIGT